MCYQSVLIKSNANRLTYGNRPYMFVPCNKCFACRSARSDSYYLRCVNEMLSYRKDILALFVLLTYNEDMLPRISEDDFCDVTDDLYGFKPRLSKNSPFEIQDDGFEDSSCFDDTPKCYYLPLSEIKVHPLPCFNVKHIDLFFKHLRANLKRQFGFVPRISYFLVAENGDKFKRPHYHIILFIDIPRYINGFDNLRLIRQMISLSWSVRKFVEPYECHRKDKDGKFMYYRDGRPKTYLRTTKMVSLGFTSLGKKGTPETIDMVNVNKVSRYLSEYLTNDPYFEDVHKPNLDQLSPRNKKIYVKKFGTFRLTSQYFGISALDRISNNDILNCQMRLDGVDRPYKMPIYYQRYVYDNKITYQSGFKHEKFIHRYGRKVPYRSCIARTPYHGFGNRYLPLSQNVQDIKPIYKSVIDKNENWKLMKKHKFTELYSSLLSSFGDFRAWLMNDNSELAPSALYFEYLMGQPSYNDMLQRCRCSDARWYQPNLQSLRLWVQLISPRKLLGYYLTFFNFFTYDSQIDPFSTPKVLFNVNYSREHLGDEDFIRQCYEDFIDKQAVSHYLDKKVDSHSRRLETWQFRYEYLCICFQSYQHFRLFQTNEKRIADWNEKAKEMGKAKFVIQPHATYVF